MTLNVIYDDVDDYNYESNLCTTLFILSDEEQNGINPLVAGFQDDLDSDDDDNSNPVYRQHHAVAPRSSLSSEEEQQPPANLFTSTKSANKKQGGASSPVVSTNGSVNAPTSHKPKLVIKSDARSSDFSTIDWSGKSVVVTNSSASPSPDVANDGQRSSTVKQTGVDSRNINISNSTHKLNSGQNQSQAAVVNKNSLQQRGVVDSSEDDDDEGMGPVVLKGLEDVDERDTGRLGSHQVWGV